MDLAPRPSTPAEPAALPAPAAPPAPEVPAAPEIASLDTDAIAATRAVVAEDPRFGRLLDAVVWTAGTQGASPPRPFTSPVVLLVGAGVALTDDGLPERWLQAGGDTPTAYEAGAAAVDTEVDGGADVLLVGGSALGLDTAAVAAAVVSVLTGREPVACVRRGGDTAEWTASVTAIRDARRRGKPYAAAPFALLAEMATSELALLTGVLVQAAARRTPVLLEGLLACAAGLVAEAWAPGCSLWWALGSSDGDPAAGFAAHALELDPLLDLGLGFAALSGSRLALPLLQAALGASPDPQPVPEPEPEALPHLDALPLPDAAAESDAVPGSDDVGEPAADDAPEPGSGL